MCISKASAENADKILIVLSRKNQLFKIYKVDEFQKSNLSWGTDTVVLKNKHCLRLYFLDL